MKFIFGKIERWLWFFSGGVPFCVYLATLPPTVYGLDSAELTTGAATLGIVHAPGAPLYLLLGHIFSCLNVGDVGYRLNLFSAVCAGMALMLAWDIVRLVTGQRWIALICTWLLGFSYYFWAVAIIAELYAPAVLFFAASLNLMIRWNQFGRPLLLWLSASVFSLGLGIHIGLVLLLPGVVWLAFGRRELWRQPRWIVGAILGGLIGGLVYLYLPLRHLAHPALDYARDYWGINLATWSGFWWMVSGRMFGGMFFGIPIGEWLGEMGKILFFLWSNFFGFGFILGVAGLACGSPRVFRGRVAFGLMVCVFLLFYIPYDVTDKDLMLGPLHLLLTLGLGLGLARCRDLVENNWPGYGVLLPVIVFLLTTGMLMTNLPRLNLSGDDSARQLGEQSLFGLPEEAIFFGTWRDVPVMEYLQLVEGKRPDVRLRNLVFLSPETREMELLEALKSGTPVYTSYDSWFFPVTHLAIFEPGCDCLRLSRER